jgi:hypothetical protein
VKVRDVGANPQSMCADGKRLCQGILASNADCFHSSGCKRGPSLTNVTLSSTFDDYLNVHTRSQLLVQLPPPVPPRPAAAAAAAALANMSSGGLIILDPRLNRDKGLPNDAPYGTAETFQNVKPGDRLQFFQLNTLLPLATRPVLSTRRLTNTSLATGLAAEANTQLPKLVRGSSILPIDVCGLPSEPGCAPRAWEVVLGGEALPAAVVRYSLVHIEGWDQAGSVMTGCRFFDGFDGIRWKSSNSVIRGNDFRAIKYLEVTPLQHYFEGTLQIHNVSVVDNVMDPKVVTWCQGTGGKGEFRSGTCSDWTMRNNTSPGDHSLAQAQY